MRYALAFAAVAAICCVVWAAMTTHTQNKNACHMSYMKPDIIHMVDFNTSHSPLAHKYSLHLYRETDIDPHRHVAGLPVLFVPGNGGSMRQIRSIAGEAAEQYWRPETSGSLKSKHRKPLDFFTVNFQEDLTAFDGVTVLDQAGYLNVAVQYILDLYSDHEDPPTSVILIGHSMGGIVARAMVTLDSYIPGSVNTIVTLATPHILPPVSFDKGIVRLYRQVNRFWHKETNNGTLDDTLLVSLTGGIRDQMIPAEYSAVSNFLPPANGFAVATTSIPNVWMSIDHQAMVWCHQLRRVLAEALLTVAEQTTRETRLSTLESFFLSGIEKLQQKHTTTLDTIVAVDSQLTPSQRIIINDYSPNQLVKTKSYFKFPVLKASEINEISKSFSIAVEPGKSLLVKTNKRLSVGTTSFVDTTSVIGNTPPGTYLLACKNTTFEPGLYSAVRYNAPGGKSRGIRETESLVCANLAPEAMTMPSSVKYSTEAKIPEEELQHPLKRLVHTHPSFYVQLSPEALEEYDFVVVIDNTVSESPDSFLLAELASPEDMSVVRTQSWWEVLRAGRYQIQLPTQRALLTRISLPHFWSSLVAFSVRLSTSDSFSMEYQCEAKTMGSEHDVLFAPLLMQYSQQLSEAKFTTEVCGGYEEGTRVVVHGEAPFMPFGKEVTGTDLYLWTDSSSRSSEALSLSLEIDIWGSIGRLLGFYRVMFAIFPMTVYLCLFMVQFHSLASGGKFMSMNSALDTFTVRILPGLLLLSCVIPVLPGALGTLLYPVMSTPGQHFLGLNGMHLWFMGPISLLIATGVVVVLNFLLQLVTLATARFYILLGFTPVAPESPFSIRRIVTISFLLLLVFKIVPYQFAFMVAVLVMVVGAGKARIPRLSSQSPAEKTAPKTAPYIDESLINYTHSLLLLLVLLLPINAPTLVVWLHNMANKWHTPLQSHHEVSAILPILLLVLTSSRGIIIRPKHKHAINATFAFLGYFALFVLYHGVVHSYCLHRLANGLCLWLLYLSCQ